MRIEKPANGLYQAKLAQDQIEVVSSDLVSSTGALNSQITIVNNNLIAASSTLDTKIDNSVSNLRVRFLNTSNPTAFSTTSATPVFVTGSNTTYSKKYSTTEVIVSVSVVYSTTSSGSGFNIGNMYYSINSGGTWLSPMVLKAYSYHGSYYDSTSSVFHFNLGVLPSGTVDFRIGISSTSGHNVSIQSYSYLFIEAEANA